MSAAISDRPQHREGGEGDGDGRSGHQTSDAKASGDDSGNQESLKKQPWFWPHMTRDEAQRRLAGQPDGTFLVRECSVPGDFTLTVRKAGANRSVRIYSHESGFSLSAEAGVAPFPSVPQLVQFYRHHTLAAFNRRLDLSLTQPLAKKFKLLELMVPALRVVQQMYYDSMQQQQQQEEMMPEAPAASEGEGEGGRREPSGEGEERGDAPVDVAESDDGESEGKEFRLSREEEKSVTANAHLLVSRHAAMSDKLHSLKSNADLVWGRLQDLDCEVQKVEQLGLHIKRRQEELSRQLMTMGCEKQYLSQVLEAGVSTQEFDRSTWLRDCSRQEALALLEGLPHGAFLIRRKDQRHLPYVLSVVVSAEGEPRSVQHCYIVRPHGRGYGFNAALAVFESIDQLVLRHRHVSLRHYFRHLDVALTFPVGCQELLHRSVSESEQESVAGEGYANAAVIRDVLETDRSLDEVGEVTERGRPSSEPRDCLKEETQGEADPSSENTPSSSGGLAAVQSAREKKDESVEPSRRQAGLSAPVVPTLDREHVYESVDQPVKPASVVHSKSKHKSTKGRRCKSPPAAVVFSVVTEHKYESVDDCRPKSLPSSRGGSQQTVKEPHYEDDCRPRSHRSSRGGGSGQIVKEPHYEDDCRPKSHHSSSSRGRGSGQTVKEPHYGNDCRPKSHHSSSSRGRGSGQTVKEPHYGNDCRPKSHHSSSSRGRGSGQTVKEPHYEDVGPPTAGREPANATGHGDCAKVHRYETVSPAEKKGEPANATGHGDCAKVHRYETVSPAERKGKPASATGHGDCAKVHRYESLSAADRKAASMLDDWQHEEHVYEDVVNPVRHTTV